MSIYAALLAQAANEVREYQRTASDASAFSSTWLEFFAKKLEAASLITDPEALENEFFTMARAIIESGPLTNDFAPSFNKALDALQRNKKHKHSQRHRNA